MARAPCLGWLLAVLLVIVQGCATAPTASRPEAPPAAAKAAPPPPSVVLPPPPPPPPSPPPTAARPSAPPRAEELPAFPWPPPQASTSALIDAALLRTPAPARTSLGDVDRRLRSALDQSGYYEKKYLSVPDGFALVTRLEQINADRTPKSVPERWAVEVGPLTTFSLGAYLRALFQANSGYFRIIVFIVTPHLFSETSATVTRPEAMDWLRQGAVAIPATLGEREFSDQYACTALVYEFEKPDPQTDARFLVPSPLPGRLQLERAGVWHALGGQP